MGRVALGLSSAVCVGMRLIELPALLLLICKVGLGPERLGHRLNPPKSKRPEDLAREDQAVESGIWASISRR